MEKYCIIISLKDGLFTEEYIHRTESIDRATLQLRKDNREKNLVNFHYEKNMSVLEYESITYFIVKV